MDKITLRSFYQSQRTAISEEEKACWDRMMYERLKLVLLGRSCSSVALYVPIRGEPSLISYAESLRELGYVLSLPYMRVYRHTLSFWYYGRHTPLVKSHARIPVPERALSFPVYPDVCVVPCLAFHPDGYRLGYGAGYFDRTCLAYPRTVFVGVAYEQARLEDSLCFESHDQRLQMIITEKALYVPQM